MRTKRTYFRLGLLIPIVAAALPAPINSSTQVRMLDCGGLPCFELSAGAGARLRMVFDTGNAKSILDLGEARKLGLALEPYHPKDGSVSQNMFTATVSEANLDGLLLPPVTFLVLDLSSEIKNGHFPQASGTLAYSEFKDRAVTLDFKRHVIGISGVGELGAPSKTGTMTFPTFGHSGPEIVATTGFAVNGKPLTVQVDTCYSGTMLIYPEAMANLGFDPALSRTRKRDFPFTDGGVKMIEDEGAEMSFEGRKVAKEAPLYFATPEVHKPDGMFDGTVGTGLFQGRKVTFDFRNQRFWLN